MATAKKSKQEGGGKTNIAIDSELHRQLRIIAAHRGVRLSEVAEEAVREYLVRHPVTD